MTTTADRRAIDLTVTGMTCASCVARVEKRLHEIPGVHASVNLATGRARVVAPDDLDTDDIVAAVESTGYAAAVDDGTLDEPEDDGRALLPRLVLAALLTLPVVLLSMVEALRFDGSEWLVLALTTPVVLWCAWPFHRAALVNLRHGASTMDTLVSLGVVAAFSWSVVATVLGEGETYFEVAAVVTTFLLTGRVLEARAKRRSGAALRALLDLGASDVTVVDDGLERRIPIDHLVVGDVFVVRPGQTVATDGVVVDGRSSVDQSMLTGESLPVDVGPGDEVVGASLVVEGRLRVRANRVGADTRLAQITRLVADAQTGKAEVQRLADRVSAVFVPTVAVLALVTLVGWLVVTGDVEQAFTAAVAVLIIACPCALGLATPTALLVGTGRGAQLGILIKGPEVLEGTRTVDTVVLDKTGTVTSGNMTVTHVQASPGESADEVLRLTGAVEAASEHPIGRAIAAAAAETTTLPDVIDFAATPGAGVQAVVEGRRVLAGRPSWLREQGVEVVAPDTSDGASTVVVAWDGAARGAIGVSDSVKPTSPDAVRDLVALGLHPVLLTGDTRASAERVAAEVRIDDVVADVLPEDKVAVVRRLQDDGRVVAMVGDGVNDAAALAQADLGIAMGTGTDVAMSASDITLVNGDLRLVAPAVRLSRRTLATIKGNLFWAFAYNVAAIPLAMAGVLSPMVAGAAMAASSLFVVGNSLRLRRFELV